MVSCNKRHNMKKSQDYTNRYLPDHDTEPPPEESEAEGVFSEDEIYERRKDDNA